MFLIPACTNSIQTFGVQRLSWFAASTAFEELNSLMDDTDASADEAVRHLEEACRARDAEKKESAIYADFNARLEAHARLVSISA